MCCLNHIMSIKIKYLFQPISTNAGLQAGCVNSFAGSPGMRWRWVTNDDPNEIQVGQQQRIQNYAMATRGYPLNICIYT